LHIGSRPADDAPEDGEEPAALAVKRGETSRSSLRGASRSMDEFMTEKELDDMASAKRSKLPDRKQKSGSQ
jgi:hypothetical protein